jgi:hypothetical protein
MRLRTLLLTFWEFVCESAGERAYPRHRERAQSRGETPLSATAFYLSRLEHKYSRPNRCC